MSLSQNALNRIIASAVTPPSAQVMIPLRFPPKLLSRKCLTRPDRTALQSAPSNDLHKRDHQRSIQANSRTTHIILEALRSRRRLLRRSILARRLLALLHMTLSLRRRRSSSSNTTTPHFSPPQLAIGQLGHRRAISVFQLAGRPMPRMGNRGCVFVSAAAAAAREQRFRRGLDGRRGRGKSRHGRGRGSRLAVLLGDKGGGSRGGVGGGGGRFPLLHRRVLACSSMRRTVCKCVG